MNGPKKHILIADSDERALIELEQLLEDEGFDTTTAWNTSDTVNLIGQKEFDLLLVADHPPEVNCEVVLRLRRDKGAKVPVVVLETSPRHPFAEPYLVTLGADSFVQKWQKGDVKSVVHELLDFRGGASKSAVAGTMNLG
jgi:DNA-binding response OmpR family regulator